jgi:hypothetical protein
MNSDVYSRRPHVHCGGQAAAFEAYINQDPYCPTAAADANAAA